MPRALTTVTVALAALFLAVGEPAQAARRHSDPRVGVVLTTADGAQRLAEQRPLRLRKGRARSARLIRIDDRARFQRMEGFGAALTDSSAWLIGTRLPAAARAELMDQLFSPRRMRLSYVRIPMGASDFTRDGAFYSYDDVIPGLQDPALAFFSVAHDRAYILPLLREMLRLNPRLRTIASPWSPPPWMKRNGAFHNVDGSGTLLDSSYGPLAQYFVRFLQEYAAAGVPVRAITPQNEPGARTNYPGLNLSPAEEARFVGRYLAPALRAAKLRPEIYGLDHNWASHLYMHALLRDPRALGALTGVAWHCYLGDVRAMGEIQRRAPRLKQTMTECSSPLAPGPPAETIIASARNGASSTVFWNLALNGRSGPVHLPNRGCRRCRGVVEIDPATGRVTRSLDFYQLAHASKYVDVGARRIGSNTFVAYRPRAHFKGDYTAGGIDDVAFRNPDGSHVLLAYNTGRRAGSFAVTWHGRAFRYMLPPRATATFVWGRPLPR